MHTRAIEIPAGEYFVGDEHVPGAAPRHLRRLHRTVWLEIAPMTWGHFESFVAAGGYTNSPWWQFGPRKLTKLPNLTSVDSRCRELLELELDQPQPTDSRKCPLENVMHGLNWFEAVAMVQAYGARLPTEVEWEILHVHINEDGGIHNSQEWTSDSFAARYWRADLDQKGRLFSPDESAADVTIRGTSSNDLHRHVCYRRGARPELGHSLRAFRRAWDHPPAAADRLLTC